jgi:sulfite exporter TauE/SafE
VPPIELGIHPRTAAVAVTENTTTAALAMISIGWGRLFVMLLTGMFMFFFFLVG